MSPAVCGRGLKRGLNRQSRPGPQSPAVCGRGLKQAALSRAFDAIEVARRVRAWIETLQTMQKVLPRKSRPPCAGVD